MPTRTAAFPVTRRGGRSNGTLTRSTPTRMVLLTAGSCCGLPRNGSQAHKIRKRGNLMRRFAILACFGVCLAAPPAAAQYHWYHEGYRQAYPQQAEELVRSWYQRYLHREPDPNRAAWVDALNSGQQPEAVLAGILSS